MYVTFNNKKPPQSSQTWPPRLQESKFQAKDPRTPIERGIFDASQIATHLVDDAIATPWRMDGSDDNTGRTNGVFFFSRDAAEKNSGLSMMIQIAAKCLRNEAA